MKIDIARVIAIDALINQKRTGKPDVLAGQLKVSRRTLFADLNFMKGALKAPIVYSKEKETYIYSEEGGFCFTYQKDKKLKFRETIVDAVKEMSIL